MMRRRASAALDLLYHARSHMDFLDIESGYDRRIAFTSVDNAVEMICKVHLRLPSSYFPGGKPHRNTIEQASRGFSSALQLCYKISPARLNSVSLERVEFFHRIRNSLYHNGARLSVEKADLETYGTVARTLAKQLLAVDVDLESPVLKTLRGEVFSEVEAQVRQRRKLEHGVRVRAGIEKARALGKQIGQHHKKLVTSDELSAAAKRLQTMGIRTVTRELNRERGVFELAGDEARRERMISFNTLKRELIKAGLFTWKKKGKVPPDKAKTP